MELDEKLRHRRRNTDSEKPCIGPRWRGYLDTLATLTQSEFRIDMGDKLRRALTPGLSCLTQPA